MPNEESDVVRLAGSSRRRLSSASFAILPVGSLEYHGDHAPLGSDTTLAEGFSRRLAAERDCLVFPTVAYSFVPRLTLDHGPGVSVEPAAFLNYLREVMAGIVSMGVRRLLVINGHSENQYALRLAAESVTSAAPAVSILLVNWWKLAPSGLFSESAGHGHGGPLEISTVAAFDGGGVEVPADSSGDIAYEAPWWRAAAQVVGRGQQPAGFTGYHGRISEIDAAKGGRIIDAVTQELLRLSDDWLARAGG